LCSDHALCPSSSYCGHPEEYAIPLKFENISDSELIQYGYTTFDHLGYGVLTLFQVITLEGWTLVMYNLMDANLSPMVVFYFTLLVLFGSFFLLNLILAVIMDAFDDVDQRFAEE